MTMTNDEAANQLVQGSVTVAVIAARGIECIARRIEDGQSREATVTDLYQLAQILRDVASQFEELTA